MSQATRIHLTLLGILGLPSLILITASLTGTWWAWPPVDTSCIPARTNGPCEWGNLTTGLVRIAMALGSAGVVLSSGGTFASYALVTTPLVARFAEDGADALRIHTVAAGGFGVAIVGLLARIALVLT